MLLIACITQCSFMVSIPSEISMQNGLSSKGSQWLTALFRLFKLKIWSRSSKDCWCIIQNSEEINTSLNGLPPLLCSCISHILREHFGYQSKKKITLFSYCELRGSLCVILASYFWNSARKMQEEKVSERMVDFKAYTSSNSDTR